MHNDCAEQQHLLVMNHRISVMAVETKCKPLLFCKQQNLGTQSSVNMVCVSTFRNCLLSQTLLKDFSNGCKT